MTRRWPRSVWRTAVGALLVVLIALLAIALTARPGDPSLYPPHPSEYGVPVYLVHNWMHAALVIPTASFKGDPGATARALDGMAKQPWVSVGWGDHWHYQERGMTPVRLQSFVRSMLVPGNPSVVALDPLPGAPSPENTGRQVVKVTLSPRGFERLKRRLDASFVLHAGRPVPVGRGRSPDSWFLESREGSDLGHQCNHWIAELLNAAGVPVTPVIDTFPDGLSLDLRLRAGAEPVHGRPVRPNDPETPPVYSGTFEALSSNAETITGKVTFDAFLVRFDSGERHATAPDRLARASELAYGRPFSAILRVPADSLVDIRRVERAQPPADLARRMCGARSPEHLALGFRKPADGPYEIAVAAFATPPPPTETLSALCGVFQYVQR